MRYLLYEIKNRIGIITLNRPEKRNALNAGIVAELTQVFELAERDEAVKVIILKANGDAFCAGADLAYLQDLQSFSYQQNLDDSSNLKDLFLKIYTLKKIVIAQIEGHAVAGGCGLVTVCDFAFSSAQSKFGYTEVRIGFIPAIVMIFLIRKIGEGKAKQLLLTGDLISANEAYRIGLINEIATEKIDEFVFSFAERLITQNSSQSLMLTKDLIAKVQNTSLEDALSLACKSNAEVRATVDCKRGIASFLNKEKVSW